MKLLKTDRCTELHLNEAERRKLCKTISNDHIDALSQLLPVKLDLNKSHIQKYIYEILDEKKFFVLCIKYGFDLQ